MNEEFFEPIIGLEIHVELKTKSKMFCGCSADWFGKPPNSLCCPVCLGLPGALPVPNKRAVEWCVMLGLALNCQIPEFSKFDRKNYFYPDLPKGYQISQYDKPLAIGGWLKLKIKNEKTKIMEEKSIRIRRVHLEEDTGKLIHATVNGEKCTLIDFNRSGVPLIEIVTEPDLRSSEEAKIFLKKLYQIIRYLGISDADMEKGSMRLEPNISVLKIRHHNGAKATERDLPKYKVEVKNINSFNFAKKAIDYEIQRQIEILQKGEVPKQETRGWDEKKGVTYSQRSKEEAHDYRYFPEPDIPPIRWTKPQILNFKSQIPELPEEKIRRFIREYGLSEYDATILTDEPETANYYEKAVKVKERLKVVRRDSSEAEKSCAGEGTGITPKIIANWIINKKVDIAQTSPEELVKMMIQKSQTPAISDQEVDKAIKKVISSNPKAVADYKSGKHQAIMFLVGQVMREIKGQGEAEKIREKLEIMLKLKR